MGLDWDAIRQDYAAKATPSELTQADWAGEKPRPRRTGQGPRAGIGGSTPTVNREEVRRLYVDEERTVTEIHQKLGCHRSAVYKVLDDLGVERRDDRKRLPGRPRRDVCVKGLHSLKDGDPNVRVDSNGSRHCRTCERDRFARRGQNRQEQE